MAESVKWIASQDALHLALLGGRPDGRHEHRQGHDRVSDMRPRTRLRNNLGFGLAQGSGVDDRDRGSGTP